MVDVFLALFPFFPKQLEIDEGDIAKRDLVSPRDETFVSDVLTEQARDLAALARRAGIAAGSTQLRARTPKAPGPDVQRLAGEAVGFACDGSRNPKTSSWVGLLAE